MNTYTINFINLLSIICLLLVSVSTVMSQANLSSSQKQMNSIDVPTWYMGDTWLYSVNPLYFTTENISFSGTIQNLKQEVIGRTTISYNGSTTDVYEIEISGYITGDIIVYEISGDLTGTISGISYTRVCDLAEISTSIDSSGAIQVLFVQIPYTFTMESMFYPPLEVYDFPSWVHDQWNISCYSISSGYMSLEGFYNQTINNSGWVHETIDCPIVEDVTVAAGTFSCYQYSRPGTTVWYSDTVQNIVKSTVIQTDPNATVEMTLSLMSYTRVPQPLTVLAHVTPQVTVAGEIVTLDGLVTLASSGAPVVGAIVSIMFPITANVWTTSTGADGSFSFVLTVPTFFDDTPGGREYGSSGFIIDCTFDSLNGYLVRSLVVIENQYPLDVELTGPQTGKPGIEYTFSVLSTDPDDDEVYYFIDWGDDTTSGWVGPFASGEKVDVKHSWEKRGTFIVKAKARDIFLFETEWTELEVSMPQLTANNPHILGQHVVHYFQHLFHLLRHFFFQ